MDFAGALAALRDGKYVRRTGWNGRGMWLRLAQARDGDRSVIPRYPVRAFIEMKDASNWLVPWIASQGDMLALDWQLVDDPHSCAVCGGVHPDPADHPCPHKAQR